MIKIILPLAALFSLFFFPYPATIVLAFCASLFVPPVAFFIGILSDSIYGVGTAVVPVATLSGALLSVVAYSAYNFFRTRIVS